MDTIQTNWKLTYTIEYPDVKPIPKPKGADKYSRTWGNIIWSFLESGRDIVKIIPPKEITPESASIGLSRHLMNHNYRYPVRYFKRDGALYLYRVF